MLEKDQDLKIVLSPARGPCLRGFKHSNIIFVRLIFATPLGAARDPLFSKETDCLYFLRIVKFEFGVPMCALGLLLQF